MKIENELIQFEYLSVCSPLSIEENIPVNMKIGDDFNTSIESDLRQFEEIGRNAVMSFNKLFASK